MYGMLYKFLGWGKADKVWSTLHAFIATRVKRYGRRDKIDKHAANARMMLASLSGNDVDLSHEVPGSIEVGQQSSDIE